MWSTLKWSSGARLGHEKRDIPAFDTVLFHSNLSSLRGKYFRWSSTRQNSIGLRAEISKRPLKIRYWWLKIKQENFISGSSRGDFWSHLLHRKRGSSARASPSPHHTLAQERTARFTARPFSARLLIERDILELCCTVKDHPDLVGFLLMNDGVMR